MNYRSYGAMSADELLSQLRAGSHYGPQNATNQITLFIAMGGDPTDHNYARLSFLTAELRRRGIRIGSSRSRGLWLEAEEVAA